PQGWFQGRSIDRRRVYTGYTRSPFSGWTVALTVPAAVVEASFREAILSVAMLGLFLLALAIAAGWLVSSKVISSIRSLAGMAEDLGLGNQSEPLPRPAPGSLPSAIAEFRDLREALMKANRLIQERSHERDRVEAALRRVSERLELAQEAAGVGAYERDLATGRIEWSASQESLYGLQPGTFGGTKADWASRVHPGDIDRVEAAVHRAAETRAPLATEFRIFRSDGAERWVASQARVMLDEAGSPGRLVGVNIDITDRKRAEEALRQADRNKDEFIAMLGHELRNPLAVISTAIQLLAREAPEDPKLQELCDTIERQIFQMSRLLEDLLDVSRIARGQIRLQKEPCDLSAIVRDVVEDHRPIFEKTGIDLVLQLQERTLWVVGDVTRLAQIVGNLLQNANKFTDTGGRVTVQLRRSSDNRAAVLTVRDTGIGMDAETLARAFEPFMQANRSIERSRGGIGLGLALVKGLVELHEGRLSAFSDGLDQGSAFTIRLPSTRLPADQAVETEMAGTVKVLSAKIH
ncbi:MAG TPA: ATP-binding protein, partial [Candidatus Binatia bacterium]